MSPLRVGLGWDVHRIAPGCPLILGGVTVPSDFGLEGHSDADVLAHAITDALLGAVALGDIGMHFPDTDPRWKGCDSLVFLRHARDLAREKAMRSSTLIPRLFWSALSSKIIATRFARSWPRPWVSPAIRFR